MEAELRAKAPPRPRACAAPQPCRARAARRTPRTGALVTRELARAADDGYRNQLVPGLRATADAERLGGALMIGAERLEPPGTGRGDATEPDASRRAGSRSCWPRPGPRPPTCRTRWPRRAARRAGAPRRAAGEPRPGVASYQQWAARSGSQAAGFTGEADWSPQRRFARVFERLALPGLGRAPRFELLVALGAAGLYDVEPDQLQLGVEEDATTQAAKRILLSGDKMLLERRARDLATATDVPLAALDRGFALWGDPGTEIEPVEELPAAMRSALALR